MSILFIGGTDPSGAGLQTDWQVVHHLHVQASSIVSAVTSQNSDAVFKQGILPAEQIRSQLNSLKDQHFSVIKIGMLGDETVIGVVLEYIKTQSNKTTVILDPVLSSSAGGLLLSKQGVSDLLTKLLPYVSVITPNTEELEQLTGSTLTTFEACEQACKQLLALGAKAVLLKGGHFQAQTNHSIDLFFSKTESFYLKGKRWKNKQNVRGTGCAMASAIAAYLDKGFSLTDSVVNAKALLSKGIRQSIRAHHQNKLFFSESSTANTAKNNVELQDFPRLFKTIGELNTPTIFPSCETRNLGIYPVVDSVAWLKKLIPLGIKSIQLRIKDKQNHEVEADIIEAIAYAKKHNIRLFINDYWQLAIKHQAYGIHLGQEDIDDADLNAIAQSNCRLGLSTHSYTEVARAHAIRPSYLALGPIFATTSKIMPWIPQGVSAVESWVALLGDEYPLVAIGGINLERAEALKTTGVGSVAMISAITKAKDYKKVTKLLVDIFI